jgi:hypothetical protein
MARAFNGIVLRFTADGGRKEQNLGAFQDQRAGGFREPLVPANAAAYGGMFGLDRPKSGVAVVEIELFLLAGGLRNMGLAVIPQDFAVYKALLHKSREGFIS